MAGHAYRHSKERRGCSRPVCATQQNKERNSRKNTEDLQLAHTKQQQKQKKQTPNKQKLLYRKPNREEQERHSTYQGTKQMAEGISPRSRESAAAKFLDQTNHLTGDLNQANILYVQARPHPIPEARFRPRLSYSILTVPTAGPFWVGLLSIHNLGACHSPFFHPGCLKHSFVYLMCTHIQQTIAKMYGDQGKLPEVTFLLLQYGS